VALVQEVISVPLPEGARAVEQRLRIFQMVAEDCGGSVRGSDCITRENIAVLRINFVLGELPPAFAQLMLATGATRMVPKPT